jgi:hypothetical protein
MNSLIIRTVKNGFVVEDGSAPVGAIGDQWVFETPTTLSEFVKDWSEENEPDKQSKAEPVQSEGVVLEKGKALIITGGKGSGKTTTAQAIAFKHGFYITTSLTRLFDSGEFGLSHELLTSDNVTVATVIIEDEFDEINKYKYAIKNLVCNEHTLINRKGNLPVTIKTPNFIICTGELNAVKLEGDERRFTVLNLNK